MTIRIIEEPEIRLTEGEYARLMEEYQRAMMFYAGPKITFEEFVRRKNSAAQEDGGKDHAELRTLHK